MEEKKEELINPAEIELTEEQAEKAAVGVEELIKYLDKTRTLTQRREDKLEKLYKELNELPDGHYKITQIEAKITDLENKLYPTHVIRPGEGTYRKPKEIKE